MLPFTLVSPPSQVNLARFLPFSLKPFHVNLAQRSPPPPPFALTPNEEALLRARRASPGHHEHPAHAPRLRHVRVVPLRRPRRRHIGLRSRVSLPCRRPWRGHAPRGREARTREARHLAQCPGQASHACRGGRSRQNHVLAFPRPPRQCVVRRSRCRSLRCCRGDRLE